MTRKEKLLIAALLETAADEFANHGRNDLTNEVLEIFTKTEWDSLHKEFHRWNGDFEEYAPGVIIQNDSIWMSYYGRKTS